MTSQESRRNEFKDVLKDHDFSERFLEYLLNLEFLKNAVDLEAFLNPSWEQLHDPFLLKDMQLAVEHCLKALKAKKKIMVFGDFDVDGLTGASVLYWGLRKLNPEARPLVYLPDRFQEGHGLNTEVIKEALKENVSLIITADCGMGNEEEIAFAKENGIQVIVTDHHMAENHLQSALAVVNPWLENYPFPNLSGSGVAFKFILAMAQTKAGKDSNLYNSIRDALVVYAAMGTVADMVSLHGENRVLVKIGLERMMDSPMPFLKDYWKPKTLKVNLGETFTEEHISFQLAPRLNSASRLEHAQPAFDFLTGVKREYVFQKGNYLDSLNQQRRERMQSLKHSSSLKILSQEEDPFYIVDTQSQERGLLGLLASSYVQAEKKPVIVLGRTPEGRFCASARSNNKVHLHESLSRMSQLFDKFGGHRDAAGFQMGEEQIPEFLGLIQKNAVESVSKEKLSHHLELDASEFQEQLVREQLRLGPFGVGVPKPIVKIVNPSFRQIRRVGANGSTLSFQMDAGGQSVRGIGFSHAHMIEELENLNTIRVMAGYNYFREKELQIRLV